MKNDRQKMILEIISQEPVETQEQLLSLLQARGFTGTQATISRDIKQLHLVKAPTGQGRYRYAVSDHGSKIHVADKLQTIFRESIVNVDYAQNLVVIHTMSGLANGAAAALDGMEIDQLIGTLAGDDTVLLIMRDNESAVELASSIKAMLS
jgi:transcriptional regulator of arginine metabolism